MSTTSKTASKTSRMTATITIGDYVRTEQRIPADCKPLRRALEYVATMEGTTLEALGAMPVSEMEPKLQAAYAFLGNIPNWDSWQDSIRIGDTLYWLDLKPETMTVAQWLDIETICEEPNHTSRIIPMLAICLTTNPSLPYSSSRLHQADAVAQMPAQTAISLAAFFLGQWQECAEDMLHYIAGLAQGTVAALGQATTQPPTP